MNSNAMLDFKSLGSMKNLASFLAKAPIAIVALGMAFTVIWTVVLVWAFVTATGYAADVPSLFG